jgi:agmatine deiminase
MGKEKEKVSMKQTVPAELGFRMPAEWEVHEATWIGWPHNRTDWPGKMTPIQWVYAEIIRKVAPGELVRILVNSKTQELNARRILTRVGVDLTRVEFFHFPTNRSWTRDFGPIFVQRKIQQSSEVAIVRFLFNAWARYPDWERDNRVPDLAAKALGCPLFPVNIRGHDVVLEGGSIDVNGHGTLISTEECLLDSITQVRNPGLGREEVEEVFRDYLGVTNVFWLGKGIAGDDTHGHVDDVCRFVGPGRVVLCQEENPRDVNYQPLRENRERLEGMRLEDESKVEVIYLPMPAPVYLDGQRLPASYANFYLSNAGVLVPTFNDPKDRVALGVLAEVFTRPVIGIHAVDLVWGLGTLHCLTREQPA